MSRDFSRLVWSNPLELADFLSDFLSKEALGEPLRDDTPENRRLWQGISVYATEAQARRKGRASPRLGRYIARIELSDDAPFCAGRSNVSRVYELWDTATRNLVGAYASEAEALTFVQAYGSQHGTSYVSSWVLLWDDDETDNAGEIAEGRRCSYVRGLPCPRARPHPTLQTAAPDSAA